MIEVDGVVYHAYVVSHDHGRSVGFDSRQLGSLEAEWLDKAEKQARRVREINVEVARANMSNARLVAQDEAIQGAIDSEDVQPPPAVFPISSEMFRLGGIPSRGGYGASSIPAGSINIIEHAVGDLRFEMLESIPHVPGSRQRCRSKVKK